MDPEPSFFLQYTLDTTLALGIFAILTLLLCSALISGAEVAFFSLSQKNIDDFLQENPSKGKTISNLLEKSKKLQVTLLVANYITTIGLIIIFAYLGDKMFSSIDSPILKFSIELIIITFFILLFGEILPKVYASQNNLTIVKWIAYPIAILDKLLTPISLPICKTNLYLHNKLGKQKSNLLTDQFSQAFEMNDSDESSSNEQKILEGILTFRNTETKQVMCPRMDIFALEIGESFPTIYPKIIEKGFSRIPVYRDNIDHIEGVLVVKDLLQYINKEEFDWKTLLREPFFIPENKKIDSLLKDFKSMKNHLAIVVDEYGGTSGLVSLEDIIEEIVGDISDEFDDDQTNFSKIDNKNYLFEGKINLKDFYRVIDVDEELFETKKGEAETLAGFILEILGNFPHKEQKIIFENCTFTIETVDKKRIKHIRVTLE